MKFGALAVVVATLFFGTEAAEAQRRGTTSETPQRMQAPPPLPPLILIDRFRTVITNPAAVLPPPLMTYSHNSIPKGGSLNFITPASVSAESNTVTFADGHLLMTFPTGTKGKHFFDCSFSGATQVNLRAGTAYGADLGKIAVLQNHALFGIDLGPGFYVVVKPLGMSPGSVATFGECVVRRIP